MTKTVAIVDDDASVRVATHNLLRSLGLAVRTFASAEDFLATLPGAAIDCVITDVQMDGLGGVELASALRSRGYEMPVIFITAFPDERIRARAMGAGGIGFLAKPFDSHTLIRLIETTLRS
jgi:FixJ family two-component response regulator